MYYVCEEYKLYTSFFIIYEKLLNKFKYLYENNIDKYYLIKPYEIRDYNNNMKCLDYINNMKCLDYINNIKCLYNIIKYGNIGGMSQNRILWIYFVIYITNKK